MARHHGSSDSSFSRIPPVLLNSVLLIVVGGAAWQFLHWGDRGDQTPPDDRPMARPPEVVRQDLFRADANPLERNRAVEAWAELGAEAVPQLLAGLEADEPDVRRYTAHALAKIGRDARAAAPALRKRLHDEDLGVRHAALIAWSVVDPDLEENIPVLVTLLGSEDDPVGNAAVEVLLQTGIKCVPEICRAIADADSPTRRRGAYILSQIGDSEPSAIAALRGRLQDPEADIRREAFLALATWDVLTLDEVLTGLRGEDQLIRTTLEALGRFDSGLEAAVPEVLSWLRESQSASQRGEFWFQDIHLGYLSLRILALAGPAANAAVPALHEMIQNGDINNQVDAAQCLAHVATEDRDVVPYLQGMLLNALPWRDERGGNALRAGNALRKYDPEIARAAVPKLIKALRTGNVNAAAALQGIGPEAEAAVPALIEALAEPDSPIAQRALSALGRIGPAAHPAVPRMLELLDYDFKDENMHRWIVENLGRIGANASAAVPKLVAIIEASQNVSFRGAREMVDSKARAAIIALGHMGPAAGTAVPLLLELLPEPYASYPALGALERIAGDDPSQRPAIVAAALARLEAAVSEADPVNLSRQIAFQVVAIRILGRFGKPSPRAVSAIAAMVDQPSSSIRGMAACTLGSWGPSAHSAVPALRRALNEPANAYSRDFIPVGFLNASEIDPFYDDDSVYWDAIPYPTARRSVRFAVLKALGQIESQTNGRNEGRPAD